MAAISNGIPTSTIAPSTGERKTRTIDTAKKATSAPREHVHHSRDPLDVVCADRNDFTCRDLAWNVSA